MIKYAAELRAHQKQLFI